jgi:hypothetical protein
MDLDAAGAQSVGLPEPEVPQPEVERTEAGNNIMTDERRLRQRLAEWGMKAHYQPTDDPVRIGAQHAEMLAVLTEMGPTLNQLKRERMKMRTLLLEALVILDRIWEEPNPDEFDLNGIPEWLAKMREFLSDGPTWNEPKPK